MRKRIESLDFLRGFTIAAMIMVNTPGTWDHVYTPLLHANWHGLTPTDLIFPFFLFIVGTSIYFAYQSKPSTISTYKKILIRSLKLIGLGLVLNAFVPYFPFVTDLETLRYTGVLQRIGIVFFISAILFLNCNGKILFWMSIIILSCYWLFLGYVPFSDGSIPTFDRASNNWVMYIDSRVIGNHMWKHDYDPEGLLSTLPAIVSCLFGILIGRIVERINTSIVSLLGIALLFLISGYVMHYWFPINKSIWSSSFVLVSCGWGTLILAVIYFLTDIKKIKMGSIFKYVGRNSITIYFMSSFISRIFYLTNIKNTNVHSWLYENLFNYNFLSNKLSSLLYAIVTVLFYLGLSYVLHRKKIYIKV